MTTLERLETYFIGLENVFLKFRIRLILDVLHEASYDTLVLGLAIAHVG